MNIGSRKFAVFAGDVVLFFAALCAAIALRRPQFVSLAYLGENALYFAPLLPFWAGAFALLGLYDLRRVSNVTYLLQDALLAAPVNAALAVAFFYMAFAQNTPKTNLLLTVVIFHLLAFSWRRAWVKSFLKNYAVQRVAFWGDNPLTAELKAEIARNKTLGFSIVELPELRTGGEDAAGGFWHPDSAGEAQFDSGMDLLIVDAEQIEENPALGRLIISTAVMRAIPILTHLDFYEEIYAKVPSEHAAKPSWLFSHVLHGRNRFYSELKGAADRFSAFLLLFILWPLLLLVALVSRIADGPGPFYRQKRTGYLGRAFLIWKFRTMRANADECGPLYKADGPDKRVTALGALLRRTRLDEMPQLINVLRGEMSLVGPRPEWVEEVRILEQKVPHYHLRHLVHPGITGWAQVNFKATSEAADWHEKLRYDMFYVKNISPGLDLRILLRTVTRIFLRETHFDKKSR